MTGTSQGEVRLWSVDSGACLRVLGGPGRPVRALAVDWPRRRAFAGMGDGSLRVWDVEAGEAAECAEGDGDAVRAVDADFGRGVALSCCRGDLCLWDLEARACTERLSLMQPQGGELVSAVVDWKRLLAISGTDNG